MHKLAILIPYFKIDYLEETISSLASQTNKDFTLYIGNDLSFDDPLPVIQKYFQPHQYKYYDYKYNLGARNLSLQWARILENVQEEWFQILGDDDFVSPNLVEEFYSHIPGKESFINVIKFKSQLCDGKSKITKQLYESFSTGIYEVVDLMIMKFRGRLNSSLSEHIFKLSKYRDIGFADYPIGWHTDDMLILQMSNYRSLLFVAEASVTVRIYDGSTSGSENNLLLKQKASRHFFLDFIKVLDKYNFSRKRKQEFLKALLQHKEILGMDYLRKIYYENGWVGQVDFKKYQLKCFVKYCFSGVFGNDVWRLKS
ncbi:glycosyltransferase family 2 protein [Pedobacter antarcticus]|uniref:glycosyltransferase family 2 protein n=1 Tax=Pedobacter antarcticus TaxID=34086 RepID=UPI001C566987|nr:glycosyltransferase family 2 protein [Pedobacter antarcticus]